VYEDVGKDCLDAAFDGYNSTLFAYGQTGAGKSYSMVGYGANKGIIPISCNEMFKAVYEASTAEKKYQVSVTMLEIYNEIIRDLLNPGVNPPGKYSTFCACAFLNSCSFLTHNSCAGVAAAALFGPSAGGAQAV
jgi:hypothetical protein